MSEKDSLYLSFRIPVPDAFEDLFSHFYVAENKSDETLTKTLLPSFQTILIFNFGASVSLITQHKTRVSVDKCLILGPIKQAFDYSLSPNSEMLVANFKNDAFYRFFGQANVAEGLPINPDDLLVENCFTALWQELKLMKNATERVNYILEFCKPYLKEQNSTTKLLTHLKDQTLNPIKLVAEENNQSERAIQLHHKKHFGYSAKEINRYQRFLKAVKLIEDCAIKDLKVDWFEVVDRCAYYDQSQLIHDFKYYINLSPSKYLKLQQDICHSAG